MSARDTPKQVVRRCLREILEAARRAGGTRLRVRLDAAGLRVTAAVRPAPPPPSPDDLPAALRAARPSVRRVYRSLRDIRATGGLGAAVFPAAVRARIEADDADRFASIDTVNHALRALRDLGLARSVPGRGWALTAQYDQETPSWPAAAPASPARPSPSAPGPTSYSRSSTSSSGGTAPPTG